MSSPLKEGMGKGRRREGHEGKHRKEERGKVLEKEEEVLVMYVTFSTFSSDGNRTLIFIGLFNSLRCQNNIRVTFP